MTGIDGTDSRLFPKCQGDYECVHFDSLYDYGQCVDCSDPQFGYDCPYWDCDLVAPAETQCGYASNYCPDITCSGGVSTNHHHDTGDWNVTYEDAFTVFNNDFWYKDTPCASYASYVDKYNPGQLKIDMEQWDDGQIYGGCVYSKYVGVGIHALLPRPSPDANPGPSPQA